MSTENVYTLYSKFWKITKISFFFLLTPNTKKFGLSLFLLCLLYGYIIYKALNDCDDFSSRTQNSLTVLLDRIVILANAILWVTAVLSLYKHEGKVKHLQFLINDFDICLRKHARINFSTKHKSKKTVNILIIIFWLTNIYYIGKTVFLCLYFERVKWILVVQVVYKHIITFALTRNTIFISFVYWRFFFLNKYIKSLYQTPVTKISTVSNVYSCIEWKNEEYQLSLDTKLMRIKSIQNSVSLSKILHDQLRNVVDVFNGSTGRFYAHLVLVVIVEQLKCLLHIFIVLRLFYMRQEIHVLAWFFSFSDLCFSYMSQFSLTLYIASHLQAESFKTGSYVHNLFFYIKSNMEVQKYLITDLRLFALEIIHRKVKISASDVYEIDWPNFLMVLGEILSYILFIIQYQLNVDRKF